MLRAVRSSFLLAFVGACARAPLPEVERHPATLQLTPTGTELERAPVRSVRTCLPSEAAETEAWSVEAASYQFAPTEDLEPGRTTLVLTSSGRANVRIPGPFQEEDFNQVAIHMASAEVVDLGLVLERANGTTRSLGRREIRTGGEPSMLVFDVPAPHRAPRSESPPPIEALSIRVLSRAADLEIDAVELLFRPWDQWLPDATAAPELVLLGQEGRSAVGLGSQRSLECSLRPEPGSRLCFSYAVPPFLPQTPGRKSLLVQVLEASRTLVEERYPLTDRRGEAAEDWQSASIDLGVLTGHDLTVRFSLRGQDPTACALTPPHVARPGIVAPTVLLITSDTHRADHLGCAPGTAGLQTPALDALAARGVLFEDCFSQTNATRPSHAALMTATHPRDHGVITNVSRLSEAAPTLAERFHAAGYLTYAAVSASPVFPIDSGLEQGFDLYSRPSGLERRGSEAIADILRWLPEAEGVPLFVWLHVFDAHAPYEPPTDLEELYDPTDGPLAAVPMPLPEKLELSWHPRVADLRFIAAAYKSEVTGLDRELTEIFADPRIASGITAFTADHGESLYAHDLYFTHSGLYTDTLRIPLILVWPGAPAGRRIERPVQQLDVGRTLLDLAGLESLPFPGLDLLTDDESGRPRFALAANGWCASVTDGDWHMILHLRTRLGERDGHVLQPRRKHQTELYDLRSDPRCERDLVEERSEQARKLRARLVQWLLDAPSQTWSEAPGVADLEMLEGIEALGYATGDEPVASSSWWDAGCACEECQKFE